MAVHSTGAAEVTTIVLPRRCDSTPSGLDVGCEHTFLLTTPRRRRRTLRSAAGGAQALEKNFAAQRGSPPAAPTPAAVHPGPKTRSSSAQLSPQLVLALALAKDELRSPPSASPSSEPQPGHRQPRPWTSPTPMRQPVLSEPVGAKPMGRVQQKRPRSSPCRVEARDTNQLAIEGDSEGNSGMHEIIRLRKLLHIQAIELQETKAKLRRTTTELDKVKGANDELNLKLAHLERADRMKSSELFEERHVAEDLSRQVKAMGQNLLSLLSDAGTGARAGPIGAGSPMGLQKRCRKLVQEKAVLTLQSSLLQRQKGWAEAKARVLKDEITSVYLGITDQVREESDFEVATYREFSSPRADLSSVVDIPQPYDLLVSHEYGNKEIVVDFLTELTCSQGQFIEHFLNSPRVYCESLRHDCLEGIGLEFYALWKNNGRWPRILRAVERVCHLNEYRVTFDTFSAEVTRLIRCAHARLWVVDHLRACMWTLLGRGERRKALEIPLPQSPSDLSQCGIAAAACALERIVRVADMRQDSRFRADADTPPDGVAKNCLCVPIHSQRKGEESRIAVIVQAVNKLDEPCFDMEADTRALILLGRISTEVLQVCQENSASSKNASRKETLLQLFSEKVPCTEVDLMTVLDEGLRVFLSKANVLHVIGCNRGVTNSTRFELQRSRTQNVVTCGRIERVKGIVASVCTSLCSHSCSVGSKDSLYDSSVDLPRQDRCVLHTVPIVDGLRCLAVVQFICPEREPGEIGDDGKYDAVNESHKKILQTLLLFIKNHLCLMSETTADSRHSSKC